MRFRRAAYFGISAAFLATAVPIAACIPDLITDPPVFVSQEAGGGGPPRCGDGVVQNVGAYDGGSTPADEECDPSNGLDAGADAGQIGCTSDCKIDCVGGEIDRDNGHCYFVATGGAISLNDGIGSAEQLCESASGHVVTFADEAERAFVESKFADTTRVGLTAGYWMGLSLDLTRVAYVTIDLDQNRTPGWAPTCTGCYAPPNVDGGIPRLVYDAGGSCVIDVVDAGWSQLPCSSLPTSIPVVCEREPIGDYWSTCNFGLCASLPETVTQKRYLFSPSLVSASQAADECKGVGGSLVVFGTRQERETLFRTLVHHFEIARTSDPSVRAPQDVWIGYSVDADGGEGWDGDGGFVGSPWGDGQPAKNVTLPARAYATLVNADLQAQNYDVQLAHDDQGDVTRPYVCQY